MNTDQETDFLFRLAFYATSLVIVFMLGLILVPKISKLETQPQITVVTRCDPHAEHCWEETWEGNSPYRYPGICNMRVCRHCDARQRLIADENRKWEAVTR